MEALEAQGVCRGYGKGSTRIEVLKDFSLKLAPGAFEALMGPSGSGKSTFLHLAAGLFAPSAGTISIGGREVTAMSDAAAARFRRRHVGVIFQSFNLVESLTVAENVVLPVKLDGGRPDAKRLAGLLERLGLAGKEKRRPGELSGGERQRTAVARALFADPDVILADEPTGNLDVAAARALCETLREVNQVSRAAILLVTHDPVTAAAAQRVHFLRDGAIAASCETRHDAAEVGRAYVETYR